MKPTLLTCFLLTLCLFATQPTAAGAQDGNQPPPPPTRTLTEIFNVQELVDNSHPQIGGDIPKFGLWAIGSLAFLVAMVKAPKIPNWVGILATTAAMLVLGLILGINIIVVGIIVIIGGAAAFYARQQQ